MAARDYESAPASEELGLVQVINGLVSDLQELRAGKISTQDAIARSLLAKQIFNGVRIYLTGTKLLAERAKPVAAISDPRA
jgi:hypothetical protein